MKRTLLLLTAILILIGSASAQMGMTAAPSKDEMKAIQLTDADDEVAVMETDKGTIILGFFPDVAPNHVARIKELAKEGFYDGILFHRLIPNFVIQAGDPQTKIADFPKARMGTGGSGQNVKAEFNSRPHVRGTWSMARAQSPDSGDSQFFICHGRTASLDNKYTVFGQVIEGIEVVDEIVMSERDKRDNPLEPISIVKMTIQKKSDLK